MCRSVAVQPLDFECTSGFVGEIHLDSRGSFDTFLRQECLLDASDEDITELLDAVDFEQDAVFVAAGLDGLGDARCLENRELDDAQVCSNGLKVLFSDVFRTIDEQCPATTWTVAFAIDRAELRAALDAAETFE